MPGPFPTLPSKEVVKEILNFIRDTGEPHRWPGHSHTKPQQGAIVRYLEEFDLPKSRHKIREQWAPCPICSPEHGKYFLSGKIAWFPDEGVIRLIGGDCYASMVGNEQHQVAMAQLQREKKIARDEAFVVSQVPRIRERLPIVEEAARYAQAVDDFRGRLLPRMGSDIHSALWRHVGTRGELRITEAIRDARFRDGETVLIQTAQETRFAPLSGSAILRPPRDGNEPLSPAIERALQRLRELIDEDGPLLASPTPEKRSLAIRRLTTAWGVIRTVLDTASDLATFVDRANIATLRTWAARDDSPVTAHFEIEGTDLLVGLDRASCQRIPIPSVLLRQAPTLPLLSESAEPI